MTPTEQIIALSSQYQTVTTRFALAPGVAKVIAKANPNRWAIVIGTTTIGAANSNVSPALQASANDGFVLGSSTPPLAYNQRDFPSLPSQEWTGFSAAGSNVTVTEVNLV